MKTTKLTRTLVLLFLFTGITFSQLSVGELKLKSDDNSGLNLNSYKLKSTGGKTKLMQKPTKKIYFVPGGKIGMFFLQGDYNGNQLISLEAFGKYVGDGFWAEISIPFRFKTSPAFTDIGLDINVMYPFLGSSNKSEVDPFVGGGLGLHFIGRDRDDPNKTSVAARGGLGLNLIAGAVFFRNYDFNIMIELKYFNYLREFDDLRYQGIGLNVGVTFPR
ncbi:MAG TPA: outer membrane beta-barrel protein [Ignavibacteria bacterium]|nr:outer membrane beta-barrel protein [Ignavibacteria bacterium]HMQ97793.1 outer membrane beta-barrel protein [Ignavibacteria bacterium]